MSDLSQLAGSVQFICLKLEASLLMSHRIVLLDESIFRPFRPRVNEKSEQKEYVNRRKSASERSSQKRQINNALVVLEGAHSQLM